MWKKNQNFKNPPQPTTDYSDLIVLITLEHHAKVLSYPAAHRVLITATISKKSEWRKTISFSSLNYWSIISNLSRLILSEVKKK